MLSNPHSPEPSRWVLEAFASDIPAWNRAFSELERKPLSELDVMLVHSFDRYLWRKGYLTQRQVEVLEGIAKKHDVPLPPIPSITHHSKDTQTAQDAIAPLRQTRISELEKPENARWLALLIDAEGSMGWTRYSVDRTDAEWRYQYYEAYISAGMLEIESKATIDQAATLLEVSAYTIPHSITKRPVRLFIASGTKATKNLSHIKTHLVKFRRMAHLLQNLFKHRISIRKEKFEPVIEQLFGRYMRSRDANTLIIRMTEQEFKTLLEKANKLADQYLR